MNSASRLLRLEYPEWIETRHGRQRATQVLRWAVLLTIVLTSLRALSVEPLAVMGCLAILALSAYPSFRWVKRSAGTMPLFPVFALFFAPVYGLQLVTVHPKVSEYTPEQQFAAALTVCVFLLVGIACWIATSERPSVTGKTFLILPWQRLIWLGLAALFAGAVFEVALRSGYLVLPRRFNSGSRIIMSNVALFGAFYGGFAWGRRALNPLQLGLYVGSGLVIMGLLAADFVISSIIIYVIVALAGFGFGRGRIPIRFLLVMFLVLSVLHIGKGEMRERYSQNFTLASAPARLAAWTLTGLDTLSVQFTDPDSLPRSRRTDILERVSLMHLLLLAQDRMPGSVEPLHGATYRIIPSLLVPRVINPRKPRAHEGTHMINIHFGLQTYEATFKTTIGWGLLNEGFVNFGLLGVVLVGGLMGAFLGTVERMVRGYPVNSLRFILAIVILRTVINTEMSAGVFFSTVFQGVVATLLLAMLVMRRVRWSDALAGEPA
ncbi:MAG: hypothetical protein PWP23_1077 [Candidatus Sumerlaeota bacterium]|nr:hypothetical protein [Candidatus Sumerlaeota bacterium]